MHSPTKSMPHWGSGPHRNKKFLPRTTTNTMQRDAACLLYASHALWHDMRLAGMDVALCSTPWVQPSAASDRSATKVERHIISKHVALYGTRLTKLPFHTRMVKHALHTCNE